MRTLFALILGAAVSWSVFWLWGALSYKADLYEWISDRQNDGWRIEIDDIVLFGYPNRFDITLENPHISSKDVDFKWQGAFLQILRLSYNKNHTIAVLPETHRFNIGGIWFNITSENLLASIVDLENGTQRIVVEGTKLRVENYLFDQIFDKVQIALLKTGANYRFQLSLIHTKETPSVKWKNLLISADLINNTGAIKHKTASFDLSSLVLENTSFSIDNTSVFEKRGPTKLKEILIETGIALASYEK